MRQRRTMAEFKRILMVLCLILMIHFTEPVTGQFSSFTVRDGDDITLPCENVNHNQSKCRGTDWLFHDPGHTRPEVLVRSGQIEETQISKSKSDRLSAAENCFLVIKTVSDEDAGQYSCIQFQPGDVQNYAVHLSVITLGVQKTNDEVTLNCSVRTYGHCGHTMKWLFNGKDADKYDKDMTISQFYCYTTLSFMESHFISSLKYESLQCEVTDFKTGNVQQLPFRPQFSGGKADEDKKSATTETSDTADTTAVDDAFTKQRGVDTKTATSTSMRTIKKNTESATNKTKINDNQRTQLQGLLRLIIVSVGLTALILIVVTVEVWSRTKG